MKNNHYEPWEANTYRTGSTTPPKSHSGLVAVLLVLVVLLAGLVSILGLLNIQLFSAFYEVHEPENVPLSLETGHDSEDPSINNEENPISDSISQCIGIKGDTVTAVYQKHFQLPEGLFITKVIENSSAHEQGIREGDVLIALDDTPIPDEASLEYFLETKNPGDTCTASIYRRDVNEYYDITLTIAQHQS